MNRRWLSGFSWEGGSFVQSGVDDLVCSGQTCDDNKAGIYSYQGGMIMYRPGYGLWVTRAACGLMVVLFKYWVKLGSLSTRQKRCLIEERGKNIYIYI